MKQWRPITVMTLICAAVLASAYGLCGLTHSIIVAVDKWGDAAPTAAEKAQALKDASDVKIATVAGEKSISDAAANALTRIADTAATSIKQYGDVAPVAKQAIQDTAANINRPCRGAAGPDACGTLAEANKAMSKVGDEIVTTQIEERRTIPHVNNAMDAFRDAALGITTDANSLNSILGAEAIQRGMKNLADTTGSWAAVTEDFRQVADKERANWMKPTKWYMQPIKKSGDLLDIAGAIAHPPF